MAQTPPIFLELPHVVPCLLTLSQPPVLPPRQSQHPLMASSIFGFLTIFSYVFMLPFLMWNIRAELLLLLCAVSERSVSAINE